MSGPNTPVDPVVPIDVAFFPAEQGRVALWRVLHADGTMLYESDTEGTARARLDALRSLAKTRMSAGFNVTGQDMLTLFPPTAPAGLLLSALSAGELAREDVFDVPSGTWKMRNVEIFRSGTALKRVRGEWKALHFTADDVRHFVEAFAALGWTPPVKIGHGEDQAIVLEKLPSLARVVAVRDAKVTGPGGSEQLGLFADLEKVPTQLRDAIREGRLFQRSIEFWSNQVPKPNGEGVFARVLKAVALLGSELPAVPGMPALDVASSSFAGDAVTVNLTMETQKMDPTDKGPGAIQLSAEEFEKLTQGNATLKAEAERLAGQNADLLKRTERLEIERRVEGATTAASRLRDAGRITPAQEPFVLELLKTLDDDKKDAVAVTLSTKDGTKESKYSQRAALLALIDTFPAHPNAPGAAKSRGIPRDHGVGGQSVGSSSYEAMSTVERSAAVAKLGGEYFEKATSDKTGLTMLQCYEKARKDLIAGTASVELQTTEVPR